MNNYEFPLPLQNLVNEQHKQFVQANHIHSFRDPETGGIICQDDDLLHDGYAAISEVMEYAIMAARDYLAGPEEAPAYSVKLAFRCAYRIMRAYRQQAIRDLIADGSLMETFFEAALEALRPETRKAA